jgi:hypothetical protein
MKEKSPVCFKDKIFHHGQLKHSALASLRDALIIIDEIDTGDKEFQVLHRALKDAGVLNVEYMQQNNIRFVFISATMIKELYELYRWGELHFSYTMTIPDSYIGHIEFLELGIIQEFYQVNTPSSAAKWIQEDILDHYGSDNRIHIIRATQKTSDIIQNECIRRGIDCRNHTSSDKVEDDVLKELFEGAALTRHVVLIVKGFFRRANLIPNDWKLRIGATHELFTKKVDNNVQSQGLPGRMSGYWRYIIEAGHRTGPYRTSMEAIRECELSYSDPFGRNNFKTSGFTKKNGKVKNSSPIFITPKNIEGLVAGPRATCTNVVSKFYICEPENKQAVLRQIEEENRAQLGSHAFKGDKLFINDKRAENGQWMGYRRAWAVFAYEDLETEEWGLGANEKARVTVCYRAGQVGLILRYMRPPQGASAQP